MKYCLSALSEVDAALRPAQRILIASDFDGTLCPIADSPADVRLGAAITGILSRLAECDRIALAVISGRSFSDVSCRLPFRATVSGNHGLEIRAPGLDFEHPEASALRPELAAACEAVRAALRNWPGAWVEDKGLSATAHFRAVDRRYHRCLLKTARHCLGRFGNRFALRAGNHTLEIRPKVAWEKGQALNHIRESAGPFQGCICLGDDRTDETMFRANPDGVNIRVGRMQPTVASYYLLDPAEVAIFLSHVLDFCEFGEPESRARLICA